MGSEKHRTIRPRRGDPPVVALFSTQQPAWSGFQHDNPHGPIIPLPPKKNVILRKALRSRRIQYPQNSRSGFCDYAQNDNSMEFGGNRIIQPRRGDPPVVALHPTTRMVRFSIR